MFGNSALQALLRCIIWLLVGYVLFLCLLAIPYFQKHVVYLHRVTLTWFQDVNKPERWGFLHKQVTPFFLKTADNVSLHAWHILPLELYRRHEFSLLEEPPPKETFDDSRLSFRLLRDDPDSLLILYFHGAAGTLASGWRPQSYRALSAGAPQRIHIVAIDYRGFGKSTGTPSEAGLREDALALARWAMSEAAISPSRIAVFGQSLGTAIAVDLVHHLAIARRDPVLFAGMVLVAPFVDVKKLTTTYRIARTIPLLSPIADFPILLQVFHKFIVSKWSSKEKLIDLVAFYRTLDSEQRKHPRYYINLIHANDDFDVPWSHSEEIFRDLVVAQKEDVASEVHRLDLGAGGFREISRSEHGVIRKDILNHGLHDVIMSYPVCTLAVLRTFQNAE